MTLLTLSGLSVQRGRHLALDRLDLRIGAGEFVGLLGPNGAGKTTLMRAALGLLPHEGHSSLAAIPPERRARLAAFLPQHREIAWPVSVKALVALGRAPYGNGTSVKDQQAILSALDRLGLSEAAHRDARTLSGGEFARALIARALAQETPLLVADEPAAGLDPEHQLRMMQLFQSLAAEGRSVMASIHDIGLAARYCSRVIVLRQGRLIADGPPDEVLSDRLLSEVFGLKVHRVETADGPLIMPVGITR